VRVLSAITYVHEILMKTAAMKKEMAAGTVANAATRTGVLTEKAAEARTAILMSAAEVTITREETAIHLFRVYKRHVR